MQLPQKIEIETIPKFVKFLKISKLMGLHKINITFWYLLKIAQIVKVNKIDQIQGTEAEFAPPSTPCIDIYFY